MQVVRHTTLLESHGLICAVNRTEARTKVIGLATGLHHTNIRTERGRLERAQPGGLPEGLSDLVHNFRGVEVMVHVVVPEARLVGKTVAHQLAGDALPLGQVNAGADPHLVDFIAVCAPRPGANVEFLKKQLVVQWKRGGRLEV